MTPTSGAEGQPLGRTVGSNLVGAALSALATFGVTVAITRGLPTDTAGTVFSMTSLFLILGALAQFGAQTGLVYFLPQARVAKEPDQARDWFLAAAGPVAVLTAVVVAAVLLGRGPLSEGLVGRDQGELAAQFLAILALCLPFFVIEHLSLAACRGLGRMRVYVRTELILRPTVQLVLICCVALSSYGRAHPWLVVAAWVLPYVPAALLAAGQLRSAARAEGWPRSGSLRSRTSRFWHYTGPRGLTGLAQVAMQRLDVVLVGALAGTVQAAIYLAATRFVVVGQLASNVMTLATQPTLSHALATGDDARAQTAFRKSTIWLMTLAWPLYVTLAVHGDTLLLVFGRQYASASEVLLLLAAAMLFSTAVGMVDMVLTMSGRTWWTFINTAAALVTMVIADLALVPEYGASGAAVGWAVAIVVRNVLALAQLWHFERLHAFNLNATIVAVLSLTCFGVVGLLAREIVPGLPALLVASGVGGLAYLAGLIVFRRRLALTELITLRRR